MGPRTMTTLGLAAYAAFLVATMPASFIAARAADAAPGRIELRGAQGTLWSGSARARIRLAGGDVLLDRISWRFAPTRLASARLAFEVKATGRGIEAAGQLARGPATWEARDAAASLDAALLTPLAPMLAAWHPGGRVAISSASIAWDDRSVRGAVRADWNDLALALSEVRPLGSYRLEARADGGPASLALATLSGPLRIAARGTFAPPSDLTVSGEARADGASAAALEPLLNLIGPRRPDGARAIEIRLH